MSLETPTPAPVPAVPAGWYPDTTNGGIRWWDGYRWTEHVQGGGTTVVVNTPKRVNHAFHLIMTICTGGLWLPVWIIVALAKS